MTAIPINGDFWNQIYKRRTWLLKGIGEGKVFIVDMRESSQRHLEERKRKSAANEIERRGKREEEERVLGQNSRAVRE